MGERASGRARVRAQRPYAHAITRLCDPLTTLSTLGKRKTEKGFLPGEGMARVATGWR